MRFVLSLILLFSVSTQAAVTVTVNGSNHTIPQTNEKGWGANVTAWIQAISQFTLQNSGGAFTLTAEVDTGATYGFKVPYIKTATSTPATAGVLRLAVSNSIGWRNNANSANLLLAVDGSDNLTFNGSAVNTPATATAQDSTFRIYDNGDTTKKIAFEASGITTATTRTLTVPDADLTIVGATTTQTLTNKSISGASNTFTNIPAATALTGAAPIANGGTNNASLGVDAGGVYYSDGSKLVNLAHGTSGNVLTSGGTGAPTWTSPLVNPMNTGGDIIYGGASGAATRLANGLTTQLLMSNASTNAPSWAYPINSVLTKATTYSIDPADSLILCSGSAFTVTLPTAVGVTGKQYQIKKTDSSLTNIITIATTSSQTIDGVTTTTLNTQYESLILVSDGANWNVISRQIPSVWVSYTPTYVGFGTVSPSTLSARSRRVGDALEVVGFFTAGTTAASTASMTLGYAGTNGNVTADTAKVPVTSIIGIAGQNASAATYFGECVLSPASNLTTVAFGLQDSTHNCLAAALGNSLTGTSGTFSFKFTVPIVGWNG